METLRTKIKRLASAKERATLKGSEIAKLVKISRTSREKFDIEVVSFEAIEGGVEVFARAWRKSGEQIGFGKDGTVEIERFRIFNPPILVPDPAGDEVISANDIDGNLIETRYKEDLREAVLQVLEHNLYVMKNVHGSEKIIKNRVGNTTSTFYPSLDGQVARIPSSCGGGWSGIRDGAGTTEDDTSASVVGVLLQTHVCSSPNYWRMDRFIALFDTSAIPDTDDIDSAVYSIMDAGSAMNGFGSMSVDLVGSTPASNTALATSDYGQLGATRYATGISLGSWPSADTYANFTLNATGLSNISKTAITKFGMRLSNDTDNSAPTHPGGSSTVGLGSLRTSKTSGTTQDPKLVVEHSASVVDVVVSGTVQTATFSIPAPTYKVDVSISPSAQVATFSIPAVEVLVPDTHVFPSAQTATFSIPAPTIVTDVETSVATQQATFSIPSATASIGYTATPAVQVLTFSLPASTVTGDALVEPSVQVATFSIPSYSPVVSVVIEAGILLLTLTIPDPPIRGRIWGDKFSASADTWNDKHSASVDSWSDKY